MARQRSDDVTILGVASRDTIDEMAEFVARHDLDVIDHVADIEGDVWAANDIVGQPAWIFVDGETGDTETQFGELGVDGLNQAIDDLAG